MAQQTAVEQLIKMIDFEISMLKMDAGNCVEWSMSVMFSTLIKIKTKAEQAKQMEKEQKIGLLNWINEVSKVEPMRLETDHDDIVNQYYTETYGK